MTPDEAAKSLIEWTESLDMSKTGQYWAPRGPGKFVAPVNEFGTDSRCIGDIGTAKDVLGTDLSTPLLLPW